MLRHMRFPGGLLRAVTLSYDDGIFSDIKLMDIINESGIKCTFNINSGIFGSENAASTHERLTEAQALALYKNSGHEIAVHTLTHPFLQDISSAEAAHEVLGDRENIEKIFGTVVRGMAYPFGTYNDTVVNILKGCGIAYSRTTQSTGKFDVETDWLRLKPTCHHTDENLFTFCDTFLKDPVKKFRAQPRVFYMWGHSYEFDDNNNWDILIKFCDLMGGKENIWYATNIEIYDYVKAYNSLIFSADGKTCINPTSYDIFFEQEYKPYRIKSGETLIIG